MNLDDLNAESLLTTKELADYLKISSSKLEKARMASGMGPKFKKIGQQVRYRWGDVQEWLNGCTRSHVYLVTSVVFQLPDPEDIESWLTRDSSR